MLYNKFEKELKKGLPGQLYFLWGKESYFLEEALSEAARIIVAPDQKDFNCEYFHPTASPQEIIDSAMTLPFLAARRLVVLKDFHLFSKHQVERLEPYLKKPSATTCMLIFSLKEPKLKIDVPVYHVGIKEMDIPEWLRRLAAQKGIKISESAVERLIEFVGPDAGLLAGELEKLALSGANIIEQSDVVQSTGITKEFTPFNLIDALITGQKTKAFRILKALTDGRPFEATAVLGAINWHYREFYALWVNKGKKPLRMREATFRTLLKCIPRFTQEHFSRIFQDLYNADLEIKTSARPELTLEILLIKLLQAGAGN